MSEKLKKSKNGQWKLNKTNIKIKKLNQDISSTTRQITENTQKIDNLLLSKKNAKSYMSKADYEMDVSSLIELLHHIKEIRENLEEGDKLPDWVSAKLTIASDYLSRISHYIDAKKEMGSPLNKFDQDSSISDKLSKLEKALNELRKQDQPQIKFIPKRYRLGTTKSNKPIMSIPQHSAHDKFTEADHGDAYVAHKHIRDELRESNNPNKDLINHHHDAAMYHSKMQAKLRGGE